MRISKGFWCFYSCLAQIVFENEFFTWCLVALAGVGVTLLSPWVFAKIALGDVSWCVCVCVCVCGVVFAVVGGHLCSASPIVLERFGGELPVVGVCIFFAAIPLISYDCL